MSTKKWYAQIVTSGIIALAVVMVLLDACSSPTATPVPPTPAVPTLKVGIDAGNPPFEYKNDKGELIGFDVELMQTIAQEARLELKWVPMTFGEFLGALSSGAVDATIYANAMAVDVTNGVGTDKDKLAAVDQGIALSDAFFVDENTLYQKAGTTKINSVGIPLGRHAVAPTSKEFSLYQGFDSIPNTFAALQSGKVSVALVSRRAAEYYLVQSSQKYSTRIFGYPKFWMATKKGNPFLAQINAALQAVIDSGKYETMYVTWFREEPPYAYQPAAKREAATVEQAKALIEIGSNLNDALLKCISSGQTMFCAKAEATDALNRVQDMQVAPALQDLRSAIIEWAKSYSSGDVNHLAEFSQVQGALRDATDKVRATFLR